MKRDVRDGTCRNRWEMEVSGQSPPRPKGVGVEEPCRENTQAGAGQNPRGGQMRPSTQPWSAGTGEASQREAGTRKAREG